MARTLPLLDAAQRREFDAPPKFTTPQRSFFFSLPECAESLLQTMTAGHLRGGFILQLGYFKASGRFFSAERFAAADRTYVQHQYALGEVEWPRYERVASFRPGLTHQNQTSAFAASGAVSQPVIAIKFSNPMCPYELETKQQIFDA